MQPGDMRDESFVGEPSQAHEEHLARDSAASQSGGPTNEGHSASPFSQGSQEDIGAAYHQFYPSPPDETSEDPLILSFCACGWLKVYYFGVAKALQESKEFDRAVFVGSSAGSLLAIAMALGLDFDKIKEYQLDCVRRTHGSIRGAFRLQSYVNKIMDEMLPENAVEALQGRVEISITTVRGLRNRRVREFRDRDHLRTAVLASCCMAPLCGIMPMRLDGELMYDGGISDWVRNGLFRGPSGHGISHGRAISINPFWFSRADIRPSQYVPFWWALYPPRVEDFEWVFELGVRDGKEWLQRQQDWLHGTQGVPAAPRHFQRWIIQGKPRGAFTRAFGYRSIAYLWPSAWLDFLCLLWIHLFFRPMAVLFTYLELLARGLVHRNTDQRSKSWKTFWNPRLLLRGLPIVRWMADPRLPEEDLYQQSLTFRLCLHFLL